MSEAQEFKVYPIGIREEDKQMLRRVLRVSSGSVRNYVLTDDAEPIADKLFIVNSDNDDAVSYWCKKYLNSDKKPDVPTAFAGKRKIKGEKIYNLSVPFVASQVINTLDTMTVKEMNFIPELTIGEAEAEDRLSHSFLEQIANSNQGISGKFRALVVDDSQAVRKQLEIELKLLGANVDMSVNGEQAIEMCQSSDYDIIFLDVVMPGIDGYKVCKYLKKYHRTKDKPVIMLTGKSSPFDKVKGSLSGCNSYLTKPLEHEEFQKIAFKYIPEMMDEDRSRKTPI